MAKKLLVLGVALIMCIGLFAGCTDYGYEFHFSVKHGNGELTLENDRKGVMQCNEEPAHTLECIDGFQFVVLLGGKKGYRELTFVAIPDEGFQVKEWLFNGEIVEGNNTASYTAKVSSEQNYYGVVAVVFEPIPSN